MTSMNNLALELPLLDPSILTGDPSIDVEHHALHASLIRSIRILEKLESCSESNDLIDALIRLGDLLCLHTRNEELILATSSMPESEVKTHRAEHTRIIEQFANHSFELIEGERVAQVEKLQLIRRWLIEHHTEYDCKIRNYILPAAWW